MKPHEMFASKTSSTLESNIQGDALGNSIEEMAYFEFENDLLLHKNSPAEPGI
jgi:hypothetical protein